MSTTSGAGQGLSKIKISTNQSDSSHTQLCNSLGAGALATAGSEDSKSLYNKAGC